jgi:transposase
VGGLKALYLGLSRAIVENVEIEDSSDGGDSAGDVLVVTVRARKGAARRWRHLNFGTARVELQAAAPRVNCREHGPTVAQAPWARHASRFTTAFEDTCAWLAAGTPASTVSELLRISWRAVTSIAARIVAESHTGTDPLDGLRRIGIDEVAYRKGQRYLTVVVDHDTGRLAWARAGRNKATVTAFCDALGPERAARLTHVSADAAEWIDSVVAQRAPQAVRFLDPFHLIGGPPTLSTWSAARSGTRNRGSGSPVAACRSERHPRRLARLTAHVSGSVHASPAGHCSRRDSCC